MACRTRSVTTSNPPRALALGAAAEEEGDDADDDADVEAALPPPPPAALSAQDDDADEEAALPPPHTPPAALSAPAGVDAAGWGVALERMCPRLAESVLSGQGMLRLRNMASRPIKAGPSCWTRRVNASHSAACIGDEVALGGEVDDGKVFGGSCIKMYN